MKSISDNTMIMAIQGVQAEIRRIMRSVGGDITELEPDDQELLHSYSLAAMELKTAYLAECEEVPGLPAYEALVPVN